PGPNPPLRWQGKLETFPRRAKLCNARQFSIQQLIIVIRCSDPTNNAPLSSISTVSKTRFRKPLSQPRRQNANSVLGKVEKLGRWVVCAGWPYVNDRPHLGTFTQLLSADVYARYLRLKGEDVVMVSGSYAHGT